MKLQGILGGGTGKLGESVFTNNAGRTIVRQYNPHVRNPRTARQQNSRGRFTVASELAKEFALALKIGMPRIGALTSRNRFTSMVIPTSAGVIALESNELVVNYQVLPLSKGGMPDVVLSGVSLNEQNTVATVTLAAAYNPTSVGYVPPMPGQAGIVLVLVDSTSRKSVVAQAIAGDSATVTFSGLNLGDMTVDKAYVFAKWVPESYNDITASALPWKFPSDQSATEYTTVGA